MYQYRDPDPEARINSPAYQDNNLQKSRGGYVNYSLSDFPISVLINDDNNPFPLASAVALKWYNGSDEPTEYFYQPYHTNISCFTNTSRFDRGLNLNDSNTFAFDELPYFSEDAWDRFTDTYEIDPGKAYHSQYLECVNQNFMCR